MVSAIQKITIKDGVSVRLLITPSLFSVAKRKGITLEVEDSNDVHATLDLYVKIIWLSAINYVEAEKMDNPDVEDFKLKYLDFAQWAGENKKEFYKMVSVAVECLSGKTAKELAEEHDAEPKGEKKN